MNELFGGPYFDNTLVGANGKLTRLHKGGGGGGTTIQKVDPPPPPPRRATKAVATVAASKETDPTRKRFGFEETVKTALTNKTKLSTKTALSSRV